jgi:hypothetical protein
MGSLSSSDGAPLSFDNPAYKSACAYTKVFIQDCLEIMSNYRRGLEDWKTEDLDDKSVDEICTGSQKIE